MPKIAIRIMRPRFTPIIETNMPWSRLFLSAGKPAVISVRAAWRIAEKMPSRNM